MKEFVISEVKAETAVLVGLITKTQDEAKTKEYLDELEFLADTAGAVTVKRFTQKVVSERKYRREPLSGDRRPGPCDRGGFQRRSGVRRRYTGGGTGGIRR